MQQTASQVIPSSGRLILVSNRLPIAMHEEDHGWRAETTTGGLATGLSRPHKESGGCWIGWPGIKSECGTLEPEVQDLLHERGMRGVALTPEEHERYYTKTSNRCIWPLFHYFTEKVHFDQQDWETYVQVNERFAQAVLSEAEEGDTVFVQDFHLMLLPGMLRAARPSLKIGFFLHIPFPSSEISRIFPAREQVLRGLLGADIIGVHTLDYLRHLRSSVRRVLGVETKTEEIEYEGRRVRLLAEPLGVDTAIWQGDEPQNFERIIDEIDRATGDRRLILGVERLDYTKGIPERLRAYRDLLAKDPRLVEEVVMVQIAVPSRAEAEEYRDLKAEIDRMAGEINSAFGRPGLQPLYYQYRGVDQEYLKALYTRADIALVTPLRDGLNLVAKEYVASRTDDSGVLVLGEFTGAAWELGEALHVNPFDPSAMLQSLEQALDMSPAEQAARMGPMRDRIRRCDIHRWTKQMVSAIQGSPQRVRKQEIGESARAEIERGWQSASRRTLFLDYDGTLREFTTVPAEAEPDAEILQLLTELARDPATDLWVVSGRPQEVLTHWLSDTGAGLVAEHGAFIQRPGEVCFSHLLGSDPGEWRETVRGVMEQLTERVPGSLIEEKPIGLAWHYRGGRPDMAAWQARELCMHLNEILQGTGLEVLQGNKVVEVRPSGVSKGEAIKRILSESPTPPEWLLAAGDDVTDESMFRALNEDAITILVGERESSARFCVSSPEVLRSLLRQWASSPTPVSS